MEKEAKKTDSILSVRNLTVEYIVEKEIVQAANDISFDIESGKTLGLVGETGAGKTTIARAICRTLPVPPSRIKSGKILFEGTDLLTVSEEHMRGYRGKNIAMIFQDPMTALNPIMRVGKQIAEGIRYNFNISGGEAEKKAKEVFEMVGIPESRFYEYPHQFSGGMKQRVVIAIALACNPDLLIADEPTTALDVTIQAQVIEMMQSLQKQKNMAMLLITHDFGVVAETCDHVAVVYAGQIVEMGTKEQIFRSCKHPYTEGLFGAIPKLTDSGQLQSIKGIPADPTHLPQGCYFRQRCPNASEACKEGTIALVDYGGGHLCRCNRMEVKSGHGTIN
ncbi:MAG: ABC transporter ATP-binding protein [Lachnospiraceae bacterium]